MPPLRLLLLASLSCGLALPAAGQDGPVAGCDRLAAHPGDPNRVESGVYMDHMDAAAAVEACRAALEVEPDNARLRYQLGRALDAQDDQEAAVEAYEAAAAAAYPAALRNLGLLALDGDGVPQDDVRAFELFTEAAEAGDPEAMVQLGAFYESGGPVAADPARAAEWYRRAADLDYVWGQTNLASLYERGAGVEQDYAEALRLYGLAAERGSGLARAGIGRFHERGLGLPVDLAEADRWYRLAASSGNPDDLNEVAWAWALRGENLDEALELAEQAVAAVPDEANFMDTLAWVLHRRGDHARAAEQLERAVAMAPDEAAYHDRLGDVYAALGRRDEARAAWRRALDLPAPAGLEDLFDGEATARKIAEN